MKLLLLPVLLLLACLLAGCYGALHNQISYTVSPEYFHEFKFRQFGINSSLHNRWGASLVGWSASWWMGLLIGLPIYTAALFVKGTKHFVSVYLKSAILIVAITLAVGVLALLWSYISIDSASLPIWMANRDVTNPLAFSRAGTMHNYSYMGGFTGLVIGLLFVAKEALRSRRH